MHAVVVAVSLWRRSQEVVQFKVQRGTKQYKEVVHLLVTFLLIMSQCLSFIPAVHNAVIIGNLILNFSTLALSDVATRNGPISSCWPKKDLVSL